MFPISEKHLMLTAWRPKDAASGEGLWTPPERSPSSPAQSTALGAARDHGNPSRMPGLSLILPVCPPTSKKGFVLKKTPKYIISPGSQELFLELSSSCHRQE